MRADRLKRALTRGLRGARARRVSPARPVASEGSVELGSLLRHLAPDADETVIDELARRVARAYLKAAAPGDPSPSEIASGVRTAVAFASTLGRAQPSLLHNLAKMTFDAWQEIGVHVTPNHFYETVPDTRTLGEDLWERPSELPGIDMRPDAQLALLEGFERAYKSEYDSFPTERTGTDGEYFIGNGMFDAVDGEILYCMIRDLRPRRIYEIGSGFSTYLAARAIRANVDDDPAYRCELVAIEAYPNAILQRGLPGLTRLIAEPVQRVPLSEFGRLEAGDILFIDSSHVLTVGSDVQYEFLEILPRLPAGVVVHVHDIFLPSEYPKQWVLGQHRFYTEQYVLQAFLAFNDAYEVLWGGSFFHLTYPDRLESAFRSYRRDASWPGSFWLRKTR